jgi:hypothetical protein
MSLQKLNSAVAIDLVAGIEQQLFCVLFFDARTKKLASDFFGKATLWGRAKPGWGVQNDQTRSGAIG